MTGAGRGAGFVLLIVALAASACNETPVTPTTPIDTSTVISFSSRLALGGFAWRSLTQSRSGTVTVHLALLSPDNEAVVGLGLGTFDGTTCSVTTSVETAPHDTDPQISTTAAPGNYCVRIWDTGRLTQPANFTIYVVLP